MAVMRYEIAGELDVRPTQTSRASLARFGVVSEDAQDRCYRVLAEGLRASEKARQAERSAAASLQAEYLANR